MSAIVPASFDPFATHPFTNGSAVKPMSSSSKGSTHPPQISTSSSIPSSQTPLHAPQPQRTAFPTPTRQPVFEPFTKDRSSPDLKDVLAKRGTSSWGVSGRK